MWSPGNPGTVLYKPSDIKGIELELVAEIMAPSLHFRNGVYSAVQEEQGILGVGGVQLRDRNASNAVQGLELESWLCLMELHLPCGSGEH